MDITQHTLNEKEREVIVVGYPKSGNTWISRLLGEVLRAPVVGYRNAKPLAQEGLERRGKYVVRQLHLKLRYNCTGDFLLGANDCCPASWAGEKIVHVMRDPRDIIISAMHYWDIPSVQETVIAMRDGSKPLMHMPYEYYVESWQTAPIQTYSIFFEQMLEKGPFELSKLIDAMEIQNIGWYQFEYAIKAQSFQRKKRSIDDDGDGRPYGKTIQLKNMRKGISGDWRNHFTEADAVFVHETFGLMLLRLGYAKDDTWIREVEGK